MTRFIRQVLDALDAVRDGQKVRPCTAGDARYGHCPSDNKRYAEFTVEVNPEDIIEKGEEYVRGLLELGVTRISMGVQSLDDGILRWMNRRHNADGARQAFRILSGALQEVSIDLITGVPGMSEETLSKTLDEILSWHPAHISAYQLSIEEGSALATMVEKGEVQELGEEECRAQYELLCKRLADAGYHHYEISNWALPGHEAIHNSAYWTRHPYVGLGPGAHSLIFTDTSGCPAAPSAHSDGPESITQRRRWNSQVLHGWTSEGETLTPEQIHEEEVMLLSRTDRGPIPESDWFIADDIIAGML